MSDQRSPLVSDPGPTSGTPQVTGATRSDEFRTRWASPGVGLISGSDQAGLSSVRAADRQRKPYRLGADRLRGPVCAKQPLILALLASFEHVRARMTAWLSNVSGYRPMLQGSRPETYWR